MTAPAQVHTDQFPGRTLVIKGEEHLFFSGTSYLGIPYNQEFRACLLEGMSRYGTNYSSSRNSNLRLNVFEEAEAYLAAYTGAEAALTMSSGYLAGQVLVQALEGDGYFIYGPGAHPAVWRNLKDSTTTDQDYEEWVAWMLEEVAASPEKHLVIVCNSLDPLQARNYSFSWVTSLPKEKQFTLIIDDSHGLGVTGKDGAGIYSELGHVRQQPHIRLLVVGSLGKALGIPAGVVLGDRKIIDQLKDSPGFGGASPAVPAYLYAFVHAGKVFSEARQKLFSNIEYFRQHLKRPAIFRSFDRFPVFSTASEALCPFLMSQKIVISSFRYPTPADDPVTRVVLNSLHTKEDLQQLVKLINQFKDLPVL